jgi:hypothetical protein
MSFKKEKSQGKAVEVTVNSKEENFCLDFVQEFGLCTYAPPGLYEPLKHIWSRITNKKPGKRFETKKKTRKRYCQREKGI